MHDNSFGFRLANILQDRPSRHSLIRLGRNESLYTCGQRDGNIYLIASGRIKTVTLTPGGKGCLLDIYTRSNIVGESVLADAPRTETATAMATTTLYRLPHCLFLELLSDGGLLEDYLRHLSERLYAQQEVITHLVTADSEQRLAATLLRLARKVGRRQADWVLIDVKITHEELSEMVGTTRSRVGFFLKRFRDAALISTTGDSRLVIHENRLGQYLAAHT